MLSLKELGEIISKPGLMYGAKKEASVASALVVYYGLASPFNLPLSGQKIMNPPWT